MTRTIIDLSPGEVVNFDGKLISVEIKHTSIEEMIGDSIMSLPILGSASKQLDMYGVFEAEVGHFQDEDGQVYRVMCDGLGNPFVPTTGLEKAFGDYRPRL